jgi:uncharacterized membrane protein YbaN (DUF454 family)
MPARIMWSTFGFVALACGIAGIVLPLVPTTPFLILAAYCFARSSPRWHAWLMSHPSLGPPIADWQRHGAISTPGKSAAVVAMAVTLLISVAMGLSATVLLIQAAVMVPAAAFVLTRPGVPTERA